MPAPRSLSLFFTPQRPATHSPCGGRSCAVGFSLIEVMLAVVVLGLGILGLSAIFAGGARQQQISSNIIESVAIGLNAKANLKRKLGSLEGVNPINLPDGQWVWVRSINPSNFAQTALDVSTIDTVNPNNGPAFFRVMAQEISLYTATTDFMGNPPPGAAGAGNYFGGGGPPFGNGAVRNFPHGRIIPSSLTIRVTVDQQAGGPGTFGAGSFVFTMPAPPPDDQEPTSPIVTLTLANDPNPGSPSTIIVNLGRRLSNGSTQNAFIQSFNLSSLVTGGTKWISKIEALSYDWRSTELVSVNERLSYVDDGRFPPAGRRPVLGYVLFFRRFGELNQAMILIYSLSPQSLPTLSNDQFPFIPPDDLQNSSTMTQAQTNSLVREGQVDIGWDDARKQYFIRVRDDLDNRAFAAPGQILLMRNLSNNSNSQGADDVVRVISQMADPDNDLFLRGYLDDAPRVKLEAVVTQTPNQLRAIQVFALQPEVVSADPADNTRWQVRPVDARLVPIAVQ